VVEDRAAFADVAVAPEVVGGDLRGDQREPLEQVVGHQPRDQHGGAGAAAAALGGPDVTEGAAGADCAEPGAGGDRGDGGEVGAQQRDAHR